MDNPHKVPLNCTSPALTQKYQFQNPHKNNSNKAINKTHAMHENRQALTSQQTQHGGQGSKYDTPPLKGRVSHLPPHNPGHTKLKTPQKQHKTGQHKYNTRPTTNTGIKIPTSRRQAGQSLGHCSKLQCPHDRPTTLPQRGAQGPRDEAQVDWSRTTRSTAQHTQNY